MRLKGAIWKKETDLNNVSLMIFHRYRAITFDIDCFE